MYHVRYECNTTVMAFYMLSTNSTRLYLNKYLCRW